MTGDVDREMGERGKGNRNGEVGKGGRVNGQIRRYREGKK